MNNAIKKNDKKIENDKNQKLSKKVTIKKCRKDINDVLEIFLEKTCQKRQKQK